MICRTYVLPYVHICLSLYIYIKKKKGRRKREREKWRGVCVFEFVCTHHVLQGRILNHYEYTITALHGDGRWFRGEAPPPATGGPFCTPSPSPPHAMSRALRGAIQKYLQARACTISIQYIQTCVHVLAHPVRTHERRTLEHIHIYIYMYMQRERERDRWIHTSTHICVYKHMRTRIYIHIHSNVVHLASQNAIVSQ